MSSISKVAVLGAGTMGAGIAELCIARGVSVKLFDVAAPQVDAARAAIVSRLDKRVAKGALSGDEANQTKARLSLSNELSSAVSECDLVIEAVPEDMALKVQVLGPVRDSAPKHALLASNTSSLSITELGRTLGVPERVIGLHFFNPPPVMPLIEIVRGLATSNDTLASASAFVSLLGKEQIVVHDSPGFATSRLGVALGAEAIRMFETGVASVVDIDRAMELGYRHPMGPLKLTDLVGLDVRLSILDHLYREVGEQFRAPSLLRQMVRAGLCGKKTGRGFYVWTDDGPIPNPEIVR
jgi:3-hydroxybutyryl-CoA dehydrogenase